MRSLAGWLSISLLTFPLLCACSAHEVAGPVATLTEIEPAAEPSVFIEQHGEAPPGVVELGPACPAEVGPAPSSFFGDLLLVRLPPGVEGELVTEQSPSFARSDRPLAMGCTPDLSASVFVESEAKHGGEKLAWARARLFANLNFPAEREILVLAGSDEGADISLSISFPGHPVWGETQVYLRMFDRYDRIHAVGFITDPRSYHQLEPLFSASAASMLALPD